MKKFIFPAILIVSAFAVGLVFKFGTKTVDSAVEQVAETILKENGIDIDFSADKKNTDQGEGEEELYLPTNDICDIN